MFTTAGVLWVGLPLNGCRHDLNYCIERFYTRVVEKKPLVQTLYAAKRLSATRGAVYSDASADFAIIVGRVMQHKNWSFENNRSPMGYKKL